VSSEASAVEKACPRALPQPLTAICAALALIGAATFLYGLASDPQTAWLAFHANFVFFGTLAQAGVVLACIFVTVGARWPGPVRRIAEALGAWVPITLVLGVIGIFGGDYLFEWKRVGPVHGKEMWLNPIRFYVTDLGILAVLTVLSLAFLKASVRPTLRGAEARTTGFARSMILRWTAGWRGDEEERRASYVRTRNLAPIICLAYALGWTFWTFDQVMSMEQTWYSNLFGAFVAWGGILSAVAAVSLISVLLRGNADFAPEITKGRLHDLGKLVFAFSIFWMYLFFSQYLVIWYGGIPEETQYFYDRLGPQFMIDKGFSVAQWARAWIPWDWSWARLSEGYGWLSMSVWFAIWVIPFWVLLGEVPKKTTWILGPVAALVVVGFWLERNLLVWPSVVKGDGMAWLGPIQIGVAAGFAGAYVLVYLLYSRVFPSLALPERSS
jgi:hypothetical protein